MDSSNVETTDARPSNGTASEAAAAEQAEQMVDSSTVETSQTTDARPSNGTATEASAGDLAEAPAGDQAEWEVDSSPYESSSDDSSDTTSSGSEDEYELLDATEQARRLMEDDANSDEEGGPKETKANTIKSHNEQPDEPVIKPDIAITEDMPIDILGAVETLVDSTVLIKAKVSGEYRVLEAGSLLCLSSRTVIGVVSETLGRVQQPLYCVRFENGPAIEEAGIAVGTTIYYVPQHSTFVFTKALQGVKGSDASNIHDEEIAADEIEFSDDEAEAAYKRNLKAEKREKRLNRSGQRTSDYTHTRDGGGPEAPAYVNYDDEPQDDLYTPLTRPSNLYEMMNQNRGPVTSPGGAYRGNRGRGDRRGDRGHHRGRGGRGHGRAERHAPPAPLQSHNFTSGPGGAGATSPFGHPPSAYGAHSPGHPHSQPHSPYGPPSYNIQSPSAIGQPFNQGYQQPYPSAPYPPAPPMWPPAYGGQQHFGQQAQYPPPPPPPPNAQYPYGIGGPGQPQIPNGAAINPRFFQPPYHQQNGS